MEYVKTDRMYKACKWVNESGVAMINAISIIENELYLQKYGGYPDVIDVWDMDRDIKKLAEKIAYDIMYEKHWTLLKRA